MTDHRNLRSQYRQNGCPLPSNSNNNMDANTLKPDNIASTGDHAQASHSQAHPHAHATVHMSTHTSTPTSTDPKGILSSKTMTLPNFGSSPIDNAHLNRNDPPPYNHDHSSEDLSVSLSLSELNKNVRDLMTQMTAMRGELNESRIQQDSKLELLELSLNTKHLELSTEINTKLATQDTIITSSALLSKSTAAQFDELRELVHAQSATISELQELVLNNDLKATKSFKEVLMLANSIEAHQRRWALRILGMAAPTTAVESPDHAKHLILDFIKDQLKIDGVRFKDIDCAHRVGRIVDHKQTMLFRCFSRDLIQLILRNRYHLKDTTLILFEDSPLLNRKQQQDLKDDPRIESSWIYNGAVWAKMSANGKIAKFTIIDDIEKKIVEESSKHLGRPAQPRPKLPSRNPRSAWKKNRNTRQLPPLANTTIPPTAHHNANTSHLTANHPANNSIHLDHSQQEHQARPSTDIPSLLDISTSNNPPHGQRQQPIINGQRPNDTTDGQRPNPNTSGAVHHI